MPKFRKKPVVIEAFCFAKYFPAPDWFLKEVGKKIRIFPDHCEIETLEGIMTARTGDFIIQGVNGELYPCKPDIFEKTYDLVKEEE